MSYELFEKAAAINSEFDLIPTKTSLFAKGIVIDNNGYINYKGKTYLSNIVKLIDLPGEIRSLFVEKIKAVEVKKEEIKAVEEVKIKNNNFDNLNKILFEQLENIVNPEEGTDINQELKKANAICNVADKIISIADLSLKSEMFSYKKKYPNGKSIYRD